MLIRVKAQDLKKEFSAVRGDFWYLVKKKRCVPSRESPVAHRDDHVVDKEKGINSCKGSGEMLSHLFGEQVVCSFSVRGDGAKKSALQVFQRRNPLLGKGGGRRYVSLL